MHIKCDIILSVEKITTRSCKQSLQNEKKFLTMHIKYDIMLIVGGTKDA